MDWGSNKRGTGWGIKFCLSGQPPYSVQTFGDASRATKAYFVRGNRRTPWRTISATPSSAASRAASTASRFRRPLLLPLNALSFEVFDIDQSSTSSIQRADYSLYSNSRCSASPSSPIVTRRATRSLRKLTCMISSSGKPTSLVIWMTERWPLSFCFAFSSLRYPSRRLDFWQRPQRYLMYA